MPITGESVLVDRLEDRDCGAGGRLGSNGAADRREETMDTTEGCQMQGGQGSRGEGRETERRHSRKRGSRQM